MEKITVEEDSSKAVVKIKEANGPVVVEFFGHSCNNGSVFDYMVISNALENCPHHTTAVAKDCVSLVPLTTADKIIIDEGAFVYIRPIIFYGDDIKKDKDILSKLTEWIRESYSKWPAAQKMLDDGEDHFISGEEAVEFGIVG